MWEGGDGRNLIRDLEPLAYGVRASFRSARGTARQPPGTLHVSTLNLAITSTLKCSEVPFTFSEICMQPLRLCGSGIGTGNSIYLGT